MKYLLSSIIFSTSVLAMDRATIRLDNERELHLEINDTTTIGDIKKVLVTYSGHSVEDQVLVSLRKTIDLREVESSPLADNFRIKYLKGGIKLKLLHTGCA